MIKHDNFWRIIPFFIVLRVGMVVAAVLGHPTSEYQLGWFFYQGGDQRWYFALAEALSALHLDQTVMNIGFPLFLIPFIWVLGPSTYLDLLEPVVILNSVVLGAASVCLVGLVSKKVSGSQWLGLAGAGLWAIYPYLLYWGAPVSQKAQIVSYELFLNMLADPLSTFLVVLGVYLCLDLIETSHRGAALAVLTGLVLGVSTLARMTNLPFVAISILLLVVARGPKVGFIVGASWLSAYVPQLIYNWKVFGSPLSFGYLQQDVLSALESLHGPPLASENIVPFFQQLTAAYGILWVFLALGALGLLATASMSRMKFALVFLWVLSYALFFGSTAFAKMTPFRYLQPFTAALVVSMAAAPALLNGLLGRSQRALKPFEQLSLDSVLTDRRRMAYVVRRSLLAVLALYALMGLALTVFGTATNQQSSVVKKALSARIEVEDDEATIDIKVASSSKYYSYRLRGVQQVIRLQGSSTRLFVEQTGASNPYTVEAMDPEGDLLAVSDPLLLAVSFTDSAAAWTAEWQSGEVVWNNETSADSAMVRVIIKGNAIRRGGQKIRVGFVSPHVIAGEVMNAAIGVRKGNTTDMEEGTTKGLFFNGGHLLASIPPSTKLYSDMTEYPLERGKDYIVSFYSQPLRVGRLAQKVQQGGEATTYLYFFEGESVTGKASWEDVPAEPVKDILGVAEIRVFP